MFITAMGPKDELYYINTNQISYCAVAPDNDQWSLIYMNKDAGTTDLVITTECHALVKQIEEARKNP